VHRAHALKPDSFTANFFLRTENFPPALSASQISGYGSDIFPMGKAAQAISLFDAEMAENGRPRRKI
jgi:hypothetical protein